MLGQRLQAANGWGRRGASRQARRGQTAQTSSRARPRAKPAIRRAGPVPGPRPGSPRATMARRQRARCSAANSAATTKPRASAPQPKGSPIGWRTRRPPGHSQLNRGRQRPTQHRHGAQCPPVACGVSASGWNPGPCLAGAGRRVCTGRRQSGGQSRAEVGHEVAICKFGAWSASACRCPRTSPGARRASPSMASGPGRLSG